MQPFSCHTSSDDAGQRLDRFLSERIPQISREKIKKTIQEGHCRVQGIKVTSASTKLLAGQEVELTLPASDSTLLPEDGDVSPLWQDESLLILNKAAGITVHPCPSCPQGTLVQRLATHFPQLLEQDGLRPGIVHRLDKDTSGLLAVALTEEARLRLSADFAERRVGKEYLALVRLARPGKLPHKLPTDGECLEPIGRDPSSKIKMAVLPESKGGRPAHSTWRVLHTDQQAGFALLAVCIHTGRTHQIRVHLAHCGFPLWGDKVYGPKDKHDPAPRQMLHAWRLSLSHPQSGEELSFVCPPPQDILDTALALARRTQRVVITGLPGCGKSTVLRLWEEVGVPVWSADVEVARLYTPGGHGHLFLRDRFGPRFVPEPHAEVNRQALREAMRDDAFLRQEVEGAIHALVEHSLENFWRTAQTEGQTLTVAEVPLYLESGWHDRLTEGEKPWLIGVACPTEQRHQRLMSRRQWTEAQCREVDQWQWPEERKLKACRWRVCNNASEKKLQDAALELLQHLRQEHSQAAVRLQSTLEELWQDEG